MNTDHALFVRAAKSSNPDFRIKRLYEKRYYHIMDYVHVCVILLEIVEKYKLMTARDWIDGLNPDNGWKYGISKHEELPYHDRCVKLMISKIQMTPVKRFEGYPTPAKFRNMK